ncbi:unnamed protein product, partial [Iphiclides podalirius]
MSFTSNVEPNTRMGGSAFLVLLSILLFSTSEGKPNRRLSSFPEDFEFGTATSAYQAEGAWNVDGKGLSMWDHLVRTTPESIFDNTTGDVTANSYYLYRRDIEMLKELGVVNYRMSISWTRILPNGDTSYVNPLGVAHYNAVIDELLANGITPFVTIYHWDLPQSLSERGGWLNESVVEWMADYARILYENFGDRVKKWFTVNEPYVHCYLGYGSALHAPQIESPGLGYYECARNMLLAHARAYRLYDEEFRASQGGEVGIVLSMDWPIAESDTEENNSAVKDYIAFGLGHYMDPIFSESGNYPQRVIDRVAAVSKEQGYSASRLRPLTDEEVDYLKGSADFLGLNHYTSKIIYRNESLVMRNEPSVLDDAYYGEYYDPSWPLPGGYIYEYAPGFYSLLMHVKAAYNNPKVYVTENGCSVTQTGLVDDVKVRYYRNYLSALLEAIEGGANIKGYFAWSLMDTFEWNFGNTLKFGLYETDMEDPDRRRVARKSALVYKEIARSKVIDFDYDVDPHTWLNSSLV